MEAITWLASGGVRLISSVQKDGIEAYELAHERLIPALREVAGKELTTAERANQLLDRRVNEWLGNYHSSRYLFSWQELRLIQQQKPYLVWGRNKRQKERLLQHSWKRLSRQLIALAMVVVFSFVGMGWWHSPRGQIQQVRWELAGLSNRVSYDYRQKAVVAFAKDGNFEQALAISDSIKNSNYKARALRAIVQSQVKLNLWRKAHHTVLQCNTDDCKVASLAHILTTWAEKENPALKEED